MERGWFKWIISQEKIWGWKREKTRGRLSRNQCRPPVSSLPGSPRGLALSDLKWRPAVQTWMPWLHIKPFNHRAPCFAKKPLTRSLPRMNKQTLMKNPEHLFSRAKDLVNKRGVRPRAACFCQTGKVSERCLLHCAVSKVFSTHDLLD